ncbi:MAG: calcium-binding protein, partial [Cyanobacteria bacterium J06635_10]
KEFGFIMAFINGTGNNDNLFGTAARDSINGGAGNDRLFGSNGNDFLNGGAGNDTLIGGNGNDTLFGGSGDDILRGGAGGDSFFLATNQGQDTISNFQLNQDSIILGSGLSFGQLTIFQNGNNAVISVTNTGETLAFLNGINADQLGANNFETIIGV